VFTLLSVTTMACFRTYVVSLEISACKNMDIDRNVNVHGMTSINRCLDEFASLKFFTPELIMKIMTIV